MENMILCFFPKWCIKLKHWWTTAKLLFRKWVENVMGEMNNRWEWAAVPTGDASCMTIGRDFTSAFLKLNRKYVCQSPLWLVTWLCPIFLYCIFSSLKSKYYQLPSINWSGWMNYKNIHVEHAYKVDISLEW